ncbi:hypothetical protein GGR53DRAFT_526838 [Hypoxylon sp. FL1150]|nr:hypothetical protein GGR53DRAFT_526838 [Hypoxylon sp. FL1150]
MSPDPYLIDLATRAVAVMALNVEIDNMYPGEDGRLRDRAMDRAIKEEYIIERMHEARDITDEQDDQLRGQLGPPARRQGDLSAAAPEVTSDTVAVDEDSEPVIKEETIALLLLNDISHINGGEPQEREAIQSNNHDDDRRQPLAVPTHPRGEDEDLTQPDDNAELKKIIRNIDRRHCLKYRWYVARHLRRDHDSAMILSRQSYYKRIIKGHEFAKSPGGLDGARGWVLQRLRTNAFTRLDYEATRAHLEVRESVTPSEWSTEKKRIAPERLSMIIREAPSQYDWDEVITDATVDAVLSQSSISDLGAFDRDQGIITSASPFPGVPDEDKRALRRSSRIRGSDHEDGLGKRDGMDTEEVQAELQEQARASGRQGPALLQLRGASPAQEPQTPQDRTQKPASLDHHSQASSRREAKTRKRDEKKRKEEKRSKRSKRSKKDKKKERKARKRDYRLRQKLEAQLEGLQQQFQEDLTDVSTRYHRQRLRVEKKLRNLTSV